MEINNLIISPMSLEDLSKISNVLETDFDDFWNYNILKNEIENSTCFVIKNNSEILGFIGISIVLDEADITNIVIRKDCRGNRIIKRTYFTCN